MSLDETGPSGSSSDFDLTTPRRDEALDTSKRFFPAQPESQPAAQTPPWGAKRCPSCHTPVLHNQTVCAECGTRLIPRLAKVRCLRCRKRATSDHVICPHCGRELRPAPSRLLTVGVPALLVCALASVLIARVGPAVLPNRERLPLIQNIVITPAPSNAEAPVRQERDSLARAVVQSGARGSGEAPTAESGPGEPAGASSAPPAAAGAATAGGTPSPTPSASPTVTATDTTAPTATATATPTLLTHTLLEGQFPSTVATLYGVKLSDLMAANELTETDAKTLGPGFVLVVPGVYVETPTPTQTPPTTPTAAPSPTGDGGEATPTGTPAG